ncbi:AMP-binding protein [Oceaniglobus roseus]|uniref:AMP-binding protein n=1 Tax=Oceaniglobus roseus TaxID=1737570 RepID=UPI000C7F21E6|nr:AMP-binding protein [Kandeliimicrobium roseum]
MGIFKSPFSPLALKEQTITERVFEGLAGRPQDDVVLIDGPSGETMQAGAFVDSVKRLAGGLSAAGFGAGQVVALMAPNMPAFGVVKHGALWAGGTVTTINPAYTAREVAHQLQDAGADILFTTAAFIDTARAAAEGSGVRRVVVMDGEGPDAMAALMGDPLEAQVPVDLDSHVAMMPYSSGTTGLPKGVMLSHRNLVANVDQCIAMGVIRPGDVTPCFLPFFHIYGMQVQLNMFLAGGGTLVTLPRFDLEMFLRLAQEHRARSLFIVPPVGLALAKHPLVDRFDLASVEILMSGAAPLSGEITAAVSQRLGCDAFQGYGMSETSPVTLINVPGKSVSGSVGVLVPSTEGRIVDVESGADLGPGEDGELWVRGPQVMIGYLNNDAATAATMPGEGWLRTGDIGHVDAEGNVFISDRLKELIKCKGFQVAPAELEAELLSHPAIVDAAVIGRPDDEAGEVPVAFVVLAPGQGLSEAEVQAHVAGRLASYKHLRAVSFVESVPKSASGKILRRLLRDA